MMLIHVHVPELIKFVKATMHACFNDTIINRILRMIQFNIRN